MSNDNLSNFILFSIKQNKIHPCPSQTFICKSNVHSLTISFSLCPELAEIFTSLNISAVSLFIWGMCICHHHTGLHWLGICFCFLFTSSSCTIDSKWFWLLTEHLVITVHPRLLGWNHQKLLPVSFSFFLHAKILFF